MKKIADDTRSQLEYLVVGFQSFLSRELERDRDLDRDLEWDFDRDFDRERLSDLDLKLKLKICQNSFLNFKYNINRLLLQKSVTGILT